MPRIFVSYRNSDAPTEAGRITDWLDNHFGDADVFMALKPGDIKPGENFLTVIDRSIGSVDGLVVVIGTGWLDAEDQAGRKRLQNPNDILRREVATALERGILVIPVLVQGATMPSDDDLSPELSRLASLQALPITNADWPGGMNRLIDALDSVAHPSVDVEEKKENEDEDWQRSETPVPVHTPLVLPPRPIGPLAILAGLAGAALLLTGVLVKTKIHTSFLEPGFGGPANFHDSKLLWRLAGVFTTLPTVAIAVGALLALLRARRGTCSESWFGAGLLIAFGVQGAVYYAARLATRDGHVTGFAPALLGGLIVLAVGVWAYWTGTAGLPPQARDANLRPGVRFSVTLGAVLTLVGMFVDFNGGGSAPTHPHASSVWSAHFERWDLLVIALIVVAIALFPRVAGPQPATAGLLLASGLGTAFVWLRFLAIPALQSSQVASVGVGAFIGIGGATLIAVSGLAARRTVAASEPVPLTIAQA